MQFANWIGLGLSLLLAAACGSPGAAGGEAARPKDPTAAEALGEQGAPGGGACTSVSPQAAPFLADWKTDQRAALDIAMQQGIAVLSYSCKGIKVLTDCHLKTKSEYGWAEVEVKKDNLEIDQSSDLSAMIPIAAASISAEIKRGLKLRLAYAMIGRKPRKEDDGELSRDLLEGKPAGACNGATHYVRWAWVGAFDFGTATEGSVSGGAKVLGAGAEGSSAAAKKIGHKDGEITSCKPGTAEEKPPPGCNAIVQLQLGPIVDKASAEKAENKAATSDPAAAEKAANPCSAGYVMDAKGQCRTKNSASAYLCDPKNEKECVAQCEKGSGESCHNAAIAQFRKGVHASPSEAQDAAKKYFEKGCDKDYYPSCGSFASYLTFGKDANRARAKELHEKACKGGYASSCMALASGMEAPMFTDDPAKFTPSPTSAFAYTKKACTLGSSYGCSQLAKRYIEGLGVLQNTDEGMKTLAASCDKRNVSACLEWARYLESGKAGAKKDPEKAFSLYKQNCEQNFSQACVGAAGMVRKGDGPVKKNVDEAKKFLDHACTNMNNGRACAVLAELHESGELGKKDPAAALALYQHACPADGHGSRDGCFGAATLHEKGAPGVTKDAKLAATEYSLGCTGFDPDKTGIPEKSCRKAVTLLRAQKRTDDLRRALMTLCGPFHDKKACTELNKLPHSASKGPPPPPPPTGKGPPPPPPPPSKK